MIPVFRFLFCTLLATQAAFGEEPSPRLAINLLDYIAADYAGAVSDGKVISQAEYDEQLEFVDAASASASKITATNASKEVKDGLSRLKSLIKAKAPSAEVAQVAQSTKREIVKLTNVALAPLSWPNLKNGQAIYQQRCTTCHGVEGRGDGPAGKGLDPAPADFHGEGMASSSPFKSFNVIRVGVPGTGMVAFNDLSDQEVWDLAYFVNSIRFGTAQKGQHQNVGQDTLAITASLTDIELKARLQGTAEERDQQLAALRTFPGGDSGGGGSLQIAKEQLIAAKAAMIQGNQDIARQSALMAYLEGIEPVEPQLRSKDSAFVQELEIAMSSVRSAIEAGSAPDLVAQKVGLAITYVDRADQLLKKNTGESPWVVAGLAAGILFREGFEAVLILIALLAVIRATGDRRAARYVHGGWIMACAFGVAAWIFSGWLIQMSGATREALEGVISLFAVAVLLYVGFWLHRRTEITRWKYFLEGQVKKLVEGKNVFGLAAIAFMAVFREAFETVLFLRAIWVDAGQAERSAMAGGVAGSLVAVMLTAWLFLRWSSRLPIRKIFSVSSFLIIALAVILSGKGVRALQETGAISIQTLSLQFQSDLFGLYATVETLSAQLVALAIALVIWHFGNQPAPVAVRKDVSRT